jgi:hypothetical protein
LVQHEKYSSASRELLAKAQEALAQGDLVQASEKGWGAAAQAVKAVAEQRGWPHNGHTYLYQAVRRLVEETGDRQLSTFFHVAGNLHSNFYENWLPMELVRSGIEDVQQFVEKLEQLLDLPRSG